MRDNVDNLRMVSILVVYIGVCSEAKVVIEFLFAEGFAPLVKPINILARGHMHNKVTLIFKRPL